MQRGLRLGMSGFGWLDAGVRGDENGPRAANSDGIDLRMGLGVRIEVIIGILYDTVIHEC